MAASFLTIMCAEATHAPRRRQEDQCAYKRRLLHLLQWVSWSNSCIVMCSQMRPCACTQSMPSLFVCLCVCVYIYIYISCAARLLASDMSSHSLLHLQVVWPCIVIVGCLMRGQIQTHTHMYGIHGRMLGFLSLMQAPAPVHLLRYTNLCRQCVCVCVCRICD